MVKLNRLLNVYLHYALNNGVNFLSPKSYCCEGFVLVGASLTANYGVVPGCTEQQPCRHGAATLPPPTYEEAPSLQIRTPTS